MKTHAHTCAGCGYPVARGEDCWECGLPGGVFPPTTYIDDEAAIYRDQVRRHALPETRDGWESGHYMDPWRRQ